MRLKDWFDSQPRGAVTRVHRATGVSMLTLSRIANEGRLLKNYTRAKAISDATGGAVTVTDLCEPPSPKRRKRANGAAA